MVARYFDRSPALWFSSLGISAIIGFALILSTGGKPDRWVIFRLFLMPFCVSSYSALIKGLGFILIFSPRWSDNLACLAACAGFLLVQRICAAVWRPASGK